MLNNEITPILQLNLILHMCMSYPPNSFIEPYFQRNGFRIHSIGRNIPVRVEDYKKLTSHLKAPINKNVVPEVILIDELDEQVVLIECKIKSFEFDLSHHATKQAMGYFSLSPGYLKDYLVLPTHTPEGYLLYVTNEEHSEKLKSTLQSISNKAKTALSNALTHSTMGFKIEDDQQIYLYLHNKEGIEKFPLTKTPNIHKGSVIYLIPIDPEVEVDDYGKSVLESQVRTTISSLIGRNIGIREFEFSTIQICQEVIPVWEEWNPKSKKKIKRLVQIYLLEIKKELQNKGLVFDYNSNVFYAPLINKKLADTIRNYLLSTSFRKVGSEFFENINQIDMNELLED